MLKFLDENLGEPIPEKDYGGTCLIYDPETPHDPYHNVWDKMDIFIFSHLFGYFCKTLIFRDWWLTTVISVMFEFLEYSLEHQLPNFSECWWDHWILDVIICNGGGTIIGLLTLRYLSLKTYNWRGLYNIPTYRGKIKRIIAQFRSVIFYLHKFSREIVSQNKTAVFSRIFILFCLLAHMDGLSSLGILCQRWRDGWLSLELFSCSFSLN